MPVYRLSSNTLMPTQIIPWGDFSNTPTGTYTDGSGYYWKYMRFTSASDTLTVTESGYFDCLIVSGGSGGWSASWNGTGGTILYGIHYLSAGSVSVVVGAGGGSGTLVYAQGGKSSLGSLIAPPSNAHTAQDFYGAYSSGYPGLTSSITGSSAEYAKSAIAAPRANYGDGGTESGNTNGSSGVVIVRVRG